MSYCVCLFVCLFACLLACLLLDQRPHMSRHRRRMQAVRHISGLLKVRVTAARPRQAGPCSLDPRLREELWNLLVAPACRLQENPSASEAATRHPNPRTQQSPSGGFSGQILADIFDIFDSSVVCRDVSQSVEQRQRRGVRGPRQARADPLQQHLRGERCASSGGVLVGCTG